VLHLDERGIFGVKKFLLTSKPGVQIFFFSLLSPFFKNFLCKGKKFEKNREERGRKTFFPRIASFV
jgi:hypothetical protein